MATLFTADIAAVYTHKHVMSSSYRQISYFSFDLGFKHALLHFLRLDIYVCYSHFICLCDHPIQCFVSKAESNIVHIRRMFPVFTVGCCAFDCQYQCDTNTNHYVCTCLEFQ